MNNGFNKKIIAYSFIFTIGTVFYYWRSFNNLFANGTNAFLDAMYNLYYMLGYVSTGMLFLLAGFLFYAAYAKNGDYYKELLKRVILFGLPFLIWNGVALAYDILEGIVTGNLSLGITKLIYGFTLKPINSPLWCLLALLVLMLYAPIMYKLRRTPKLILAIVAVLFVGSNIWNLVVTPEDSVTQWITKVIIYMPIYMLGAYFGLCDCRAISRERYNVKVVNIVSAVISVAIVVYYMVFKRDIELLNNVLFAILPVTLWLSTPNSLFENMRVGYPLKASFSIFSIGAIFISFINLVLAKVIGTGSLNPYVSFILHIVLVGVVCAACVAIAYGVCKFLPSNWHYIMTGRRSRHRHSHKSEE